MAKPRGTVSSALPALPDRELVLDRYRPLRPLGSGASGSVWLARDERTGLDVALKIVPREGKAGYRAEREAEAAARLRHERCLRSYGFGSDAGHVYIAYEYVGGRTLREAMRAGELRDGQAVEAAAQILDGLAHAHGRGIVHRDVKPSNVLLLDEERVSIRVLDFGLARFDEAETLTAVGDVPGTLAYISPERLRGREAEPASDVWAVGVLLWESLAGKHPFWGVPLPQMPAAIEGGAPPLRHLRPDLPKRLLAAIDQALDTEPARRPSAAALAEELRSLRRRPAQRRPRLETPSLPSLAADPGAAVRLVPPALAGFAAFVGASLLPFYPAYWPLAIGVGAVALGFAAPRAAVAVALAAPILPLGNLALGLALLWSAIALAWLALVWGDARGGLAALSGPLLAPLGLIGLVPLAVQPVRGHVRRGAQAAAAVALAAVVAGVRGSALPFGAGPAPKLDLAGVESPFAVAATLVGSVPPALLAELVVLGAIAVAIPFARDPWRIAGLGSAMLTGTLLVAPDAPALPLVVAAWATCAWLAGTRLVARDEH
ncbi:MAG TPA: serine/threonine-protein kinase [Gaiellaceae bacterium]|nr:serine/threonine-protein kinase [Gaiellaceae bacterium]